MSSTHASDDLQDLVDRFSHLIRQPSCARVMRSELFSSTAHHVLADLGHLRGLAMASDEGELAGAEEVAAGRARSNGTVERSVRAVRDGAHAAGPNFLDQAEWSAIPAGAVTIDEPTATHFREKLGAKRPPEIAPVSELQALANLGRADPAHTGWSLFSGEVLWPVDGGSRPVRVTAQVRNPSDAGTDVDLIRVSTIVGSGRAIALADYSEAEVAKLIDAVRAAARVRGVA